jgi:DNA-binding XRE family transcriptional regulator
MRPDHGETLERIAGAEELSRRIGRLERELDALLGIERVTAGVPDQFLRRDSLLPPPALSSLPPPPPPPAAPLPPEDLPGLLAAGIRGLRERRGWTQQDLALATGILRPNIARIERGTALPSLATLVRVARGLGVSLEVLLSGRG